MSNGIPVRVAEVRGPVCGWWRVPLSPCGVVRRLRGEERIDLSPVVVAGCIERIPEREGPIERALRAEALSIEGEHETEPVVSSHLDRRRGFASSFPYAASNGAGYGRRKRVALAAPAT